MAQQATSTRELQIGGAANRQVAQLNQQSSPDYQASNRQMAFADKLTNFGGSLGKAMRKDELDAEEIRKANEAKFKDAEESRLRVAAKVQILANKGADYKTAHFKAVGPAGQYSEQKDLSNPDVANAFYKKEYELAYTTKKVNKFQRILDSKAEADIKAMHVVWENLQTVKGSPVRGIAFDQFATEAFSEQKDNYFINFLQHLPHLGEVIDKKAINYTAHEDQIAKTEQRIRDKFRLNTLDDLVNDHYELQRYPGERTISGKKISAASDLLNQADSLRGNVATEDGRIRGLYTKKEIHGAFIKQYSEKIFLAKSPDDQIFESLNAIFNSDDAYKILQLDPNDLKGIGTQYAALREKANTKYIKLTTAKDKEDTATATAIVDQQTQTINSMHAKSEVMRSSKIVDKDALEVLEATWENSALWEKGKQTWVKDTRKNINFLKGISQDKSKLSSSPLSSEENESVEKFKKEILKAKDGDDIRISKEVLLISNLTDREKNAKLKIINAHEQRLEAAAKARKAEADLFEKESTKLADSLKGTHKKDIKGKSSTELTEGLDAFKKKINADPKLTPGKKNELIDFREAEIESRKQTENDASDVAETTKFNALVTGYNLKKITKENITALEKIAAKAKNGKLKKALEERISLISQEIFTQEELTQIELNRKVANKAFNKFEKTLNLIREMDPVKGQGTLETLQITLEGSEEFLTVVNNDPAKRNYLNMISNLHGELEKKKTEEQKVADQLEWKNAAGRSKEEKESAERVGQDAVILLDTEYSEDNYKDAHEKIFARIDMNQPDGSDPISKHVFPEERRISLLRDIDANKTHNSGKVPSKKDLDPKLYTKFQNDIEAIEDLATGNLKESTIKKLMGTLQESYEGYNLPTETYKDLRTELKGMNPKGPTIIAPRIGGLKIIRSQFQGSWGKFDDSSEFLSKGGKTGKDLAAKAELAFEKWHTGWVNGEVKDDVKAYKELDESGKLEEASKYAARIVDWKDTGVMPQPWKTQMEIYSNNWDHYMNKKEEEEHGDTPVAKTGTGTGTGTGNDTSVLSLFTINVNTNSKASTYAKKGQNNL